MQYVQYMLLAFSQYQDPFSGTCMQRIITCRCHVHQTDSEWRLWHGCLPVLRKSACKAAKCGHNQTGSCFLGYQDRRIVNYLCLFISVSKEIVDIFVTETIACSLKADSVLSEVCTLLQRWVLWNHSTVGHPCTAHNALAQKASSSGNPNLPGGQCCHSLQHLQPGRRSHSSSACG